MKGVGCYYLKSLRLPSGFWNAAAGTGKILRMFTLSFPQAFPREWHNAHSIVKSDKPLWSGFLPSARDSVFSHVFSVSCLRNS